MYSRLDGAHFLLRFLRPHSARAATAAALTLLLAAATAGAQTATPAPSDVATPPAADAPPPADPPAAATADVDNKLADIDQRARIAVRRIEILEEQLAAKAKEPAPATAQAGDKGFGLRSGDGAFSILFRAQIQADSRWFLNDGALADRADTFLIRRLRPSVDGTLFGLVDFKIVPDFANSQAVLFDGYLDVHPFPWLRLRAGKFKTPLGLERLQADNDLVFIERALTQVLTPVRDVGAALWGDVAGGIVGYSVGVYNGAVDGANPDTDINHAKDLVARLLLQPFKAEALSELGTLGLHFAFSTGNRGPGTPTAAAATATPQLPSFRSGGQNSIFTYLTSTMDPAGTVFAHLRETRINPGLFYYYGPLGILGEYVQSRQEVQKGNVTATLKHQAAHATVSVVVGGKNGYDGATPTNRLDLSKGTLGALEIGARWNYLKLDDASFGSASDPTAPVFANTKASVSKAVGWAGALTYVPSRMVRVSVNFEQTRFTGGSSVSTTVADRKTENALFTRAQVNF